MPTSARFPDGRSQVFTFRRRELFQQAVSAALLCLVPRTQPVATPLSVLPRPEFAIGDLVAQDWIGEFGEKFVDFGEVLGVRYLPEGYSSYPSDSWLYYVFWTHTTSGLDDLYPCYDGEPTMASTLRAASHV
ncbi:hypothetical protein [Microcoleus sp. Pol17_C1]|uniref:hypothetical protein n=1 Tax=unclassified Microcoleus TaxID=2642155 RepID=UPI002FCED8CB